MYKKLQILMLLLGIHGLIFSMEKEHAIDAINRPLSPATITALQKYTTAQNKFRTILPFYQDLRRVDTGTQRDKDIINKFNNSRERLMQAHERLIATDPLHIRNDAHGSIVRKFITPNGSVTWISIERYNQAIEDARNQALAAHTKRSIWSWFK